MGRPRGGPRLPWGTRARRRQAAAAAGVRGHSPVERSLLLLKRGPRTKVPSSKPKTRPANRVPLDDMPDFLSYLSPIAMRIHAYGHGCLLGGWRTAVPRRTPCSVEPDSHDLQALQRERAGGAGSCSVMLVTVPLRSNWWNPRPPARWNSTWRSPLDGGDGGHGGTCTAICLATTCS